MLLLLEFVLTLACYSCCCEWHFVILFLLLRLRKEREMQISRMTQRVQLKTEDWRQKTRTDTGYVSGWSYLNVKSSRTTHRIANKTKWNCKLQITKIKFKYLLHSRKSSISHMSPLSLVVLLSVASCRHFVPIGQRPKKTKTKTCLRITCICIYSYISVAVSLYQCIRVSASDRRLSAAFCISRPALELSPAQTTQTIDKTKRIKIKSYSEPNHRYTTIHCMYLFSWKLQCILKRLYWFWFTFLRGAALSALKLKL